MNIGPLSFEEYETRTVAFHGCMAPGLLIGGFMVDLAMRSLPAGALYDVISESAKCLPDAVQLLIIFSGITACGITAFSAAGGWDGLSAALPGKYFSFPVSPDFSILPISHCE